MKVGSMTYRALVVLVGRSPISADMFGAYVWRGVKRGKICSSGGGGDYAAQMFLGRLRKRGWAQLAPSDGSSRWEPTINGRQALAKALTKSGAPGEGRGEVKCKHENVRGYMWRQVDGVKYWPVPPWVARMSADALTCSDCGAWLSLGPATDDERTAVEVRAAEIAHHRAAMAHRLSSSFKTNHGEVAGWRGDETIDSLTVLDEYGNLRVDRDVPLNLDSPNWRAGYLARCIVEHDTDGGGE